VVYVDIPPDSSVGNIKPNYWKFNGAQNINLGNNINHSSECRGKVVIVVTTGAKTHCQQWSEHHPRKRTRLIVGMAGLLGLGFGFSSPKIGVLVAIAVGLLQLKLLLVFSLLQHRKA